jgi:hypothetical protein
MFVKRFSVLLCSLVVVACSGPKEDQLRTVKSYELSSCESSPTTDPTEREAINFFRGEVQQMLFTRRSGSLYAANHENTLDASGVREYEGPFYLYVHPRRPEQNEQMQGVDWIATVYLHAARVRSRTNGGDWTKWQPVRTRNFLANTRTGDGLGRWKCLMYAEIAWADVVRRRGVWEIKPIAASVYESEELDRLRPAPTTDQIAGKTAVAPLTLHSR